MGLRFSRNLVIATVVFILVALLDSTGLLPPGKLRGWAGTALSSESDLTPLLKPLFASAREELPAVTMPDWDALRRRLLTPLSSIKVDWNLPRLGLFEKGGR